MNLSLGLAVAVMVVGLVVMCIQKRWNDITYIMFFAGLLAVLMRFAGEATLRIGG